MHRIKYYPCQAHPGHLLSQVCTEASCTQNLLICPMCEHQQHSTHLTIPIKMMLNQVQQVTESTDSINLIDVSLFLDRSHQECLLQIYKFQEQLSNISKYLNKKVDDYYLSIKQQLKQFANSQIPPNLILDSINQDLEERELSDKLRELLKIYAFTSNGTAHKLNMYSAIMTTSENQITQLNEKLSEIQIDIDKKVDQLLNKFKPHIIQPTISADTVQSINFTFSNQFKGANIIVSQKNQMAEQKTSESNGQRFIICEPSIPKSGITKYGFKIVKYTGWIGVGLCHKDIIVNSNYKFHYTNIGHGSYLISNNAYSWSHLQKELNSAHKSFDFANNDIIIVEVDMGKKKVTWHKKKTQQKFSMDIDILQDLYPCANLCSPGDTVEILNKLD